MNSKLEPPFGHRLAVYADDAPSGAPQSDADGIAENANSTDAAPSPLADAVAAALESQDDASAPSSNPTLHLSPEELDRRIESGIMSAVRKLQQQNVIPSQSQFMPPYQPQSPPQFPSVGGPYDPIRHAFSVQREHTKMQAEALSLYEDLPDEYKARIEQQLDRVPPEEIMAFRQNGHHKTLANAIMAEALNDGKYVPKRLGRTAAPLREPVGGGATTLNSRDPHKSAIDQEISELETVLFKNLTPEQRAKVKLTESERSPSQRAR